MTLRPPTTVLYEDQRGTQKEFGPHLLVLACLADQLGIDFTSLWNLKKKLDDRCMKGVDGLLRTIRENFGDLVRDGQMVAALIDGDRIRRHLKLAPSATDSDIQDSVRAQCPIPDKLVVFILERNTESLIRVAADCAKRHRRPLDPERIRKACDGKPIDRDLLLKQLAAPEQADLRQCIRDQLAGLNSLIGWLAEQIQHEGHGRCSMVR